MAHRLQIFEVGFAFRGFLLQRDLWSNIMIKNSLFFLPFVLLAACGSDEKKSANDSSVKATGDRCYERYVDNTYCLDGQKYEKQCRLSGREQRGMCRGTAICNDVKVGICSGFGAGGF